MDNLQVHISKYSKEYFKNIEINILLNGPYNCECNFIEFVFGFFKKKINERIFRASIFKFSFK